jgi:hypothetical protein
MFAVHTIKMPDGAGPSFPDSLTVASVLGLPYPAAANALGTVGAITAGSLYTLPPIITPTGGVLNAAAPGGAYQAAGGWPAIIRATLKVLASPTVVLPGIGYNIADTITEAGGVLAPGGVAAVLAVASTQAVSAATNAGGTGGTPGPVTLTGTTGTGTKFQATGTINAGGVLQPGLVITVPGNYTVNPTSMTSEPVTGGGLTGATVTLTGMGILTATVSTAGGYAVPPLNPVSQASSSGSGTGATFTNSCGIGTVSVDDSGNYSTIPTGFTVTNAPGDTTGTGGALAAGAATAAGAAVFKAVGPFPADGIPAVNGVPAFGVFAMLNANPQNDEVALATKVLGYASLQIKPAVVANSVVAGALDALIWA